MFVQKLTTVKTQDKGRLQLLSYELQKLICNFLRIGEIRDFLIEIGYKMLFLGLIEAKVSCRDEFQACLVALSGDYCDSDPFLYFSSYSDPI